MTQEPARTCQNKGIIERSARSEAAERRMLRMLQRIFCTRDRTEVLQELKHECCLPLLRGASKQASKQASSDAIWLL